MISIILPSRGRPEMLTTLCESIQKTTFDLSSIEMLVGYDFDDEKTINIIPFLQYPWIHFHGRVRGKSISKDYQNWLFPKTKGKFIFVANDDTEMKTNHWDKLVHLSDFSYGWINDSENDNRFGYDPSPYSCFPILGRKAIERLGYVMHEFYGGWGADVHLFKVYNAANLVVNLSEIVLSHNSPWLHKRENDETNFSMKEKTTIGDIDIKEDVNKLLSAPTLL